MSTIEMSKLELIAAQNAVNMLNARGCIYTVTFPNGDVHTNIQAPERKRSSPTQNFKEYVNPILDNLNINDYIEVPFDKYDGSQLQANICARAHTRWGSKSIITSVNREKKVVEVIREK
jgi:hypothetical protein